MIVNAIDASQGAHGSKLPGSWARLRRFVFGDFPARRALVAGASILAITLSFFLALACRTSLDLGGLPPELSISPSSIDLGTVTTGHQYEATFIASNKGAERLHLLGAQAGCSCLVSSEFPIQIDPGSSRAVPFSLHVSEDARPGQLEYSVLILTSEHGWLTPLTIRATCLSNSNMSQ